MSLIAELIPRWRSSPFCHLDGAPWDVIGDMERHIRDAFGKLDQRFDIREDVARHTTATVEHGAIVKGPVIIGPRVFVAAGAYIRGGVYLDEDCILGPGAELKTSFMFRGSKLAHFNFVGDSILGEGVNLEAGSIIANYRNEMREKAIRIAARGQVFETGSEKFGAIAGDGVRLGANAVVAPGAILEPGQIVRRASLIDQHPLAAMASGARADVERT